MRDYILNVLSQPFCAAGDGVTNDRAAIQAAVDAAHAQGGGTVCLESGRRFLSGGIVLRSGVTLLFGEGAELYQSPDPEDYVKPVGDGYEKYVPVFGQNFDPKIKWSHNWYRNYPFVFAPEGSHDFGIAGRGVIRMMEVTDAERVMKLCPIGFYRCSDFEISDVHITNYHGYAMMPFSSERGLIKNVKIDDWSYGNGDGICLMNCIDIRVTGCEMFTGDDSLYIFSSCADPRKGEWWSSDEPRPSCRIEIDHNDLRSNHCKAFGMILWGLNCDDLEKVEVRDVYVHDNHFETLGNWNYNPYTDKAGFHPVTHVRFENNKIDGIELNFFETRVSDLYGYRCMPVMENGGFEHGRCFWVIKENPEKGSAGVFRGADGERSYGYIDKLDKGDASVYQGIFLRGGTQCLLRCEAKSTGEKTRLFVRPQEGGENISELEFDNTEWEQKLFSFTVPRDGNYHIGLENGRATSGGACIASCSLGIGDGGVDFDSVIFDNGKMLLKLDDQLFRR